MVDFRTLLTEKLEKKFEEVRDTASFELLLDATKKMGNKPVLWRGVGSNYPMIVKFEQTDRGMRWRGFLNSFGEPRPIATGILQAIGFKTAPAFATTFYKTAKFFGKPKIVVPMGKLLFSSFVGDLVGYSDSFEVTSKEYIDDDGLRHTETRQKKYKKGEIEKQVELAAESYRQWKGEEAEEVLIGGDYYYMIDPEKVFLYSKYIKDCPIKTVNDIQTYDDVITLLNAFRKGINWYHRKVSKYTDPIDPDGIIAEEIQIDENLAMSVDMISLEGLDEIINAAKKMKKLKILVRGTHTPYPFLMKFKDVHARGMNFYGLSASHTTSKAHPITKGILDGLKFKSAPIFATTDINRADFFGSEVRFLIPAIKHKIVYSEYVGDIAEFAWEQNPHRTNNGLHIPKERVKEIVDEAVPTYSDWKGQDAIEVLISADHYFMVSRDDLWDEFTTEDLSKMRGGVWNINTYDDLVYVLERLREKWIATGKFE